MHRTRGARPRRAASPAPTFTTIARWVVAVTQQMPSLPPLARAEAAGCLFPQPAELATQQLHRNLAVNAACPRRSVRCEDQCKTVGDTGPRTWFS